MKYFLILLTYFNLCAWTGLSKQIQLPRKLNWKPIVTFASSCLLSVTPYDSSRAAPVPASTLSLEQSVERLEGADSRADVLQAMADVFEASEGRSLQARTKFKQVCCKILLFAQFSTLSSSLQSYVKLKIRE